MAASTPSQLGDGEIHDFEIVEPSASPILESLRAFGYSPETAIADLVDNSISANSKHISVQFHWDELDPWISVSDDGEGMSLKELTDAMRIGSKSPLLLRKEGDLGRFGLGLKTASFSQARELTVVTRQVDSVEPAVRRWNLDEVRRTNEWRLLASVPSSLADTIETLIPADRGTTVVLSNLDRLLDRANRGGAVATQVDFLRIVEAVAKHLELVFHRFLLRPNPLQIRVNELNLKGWDPFLKGHLSTWSTAQERLPLAGNGVIVQPFVLPHKSKLTSIEHDEAGGIRGWNSSQGFYVYRADRLLVAGSWLGIGGVKEEHTKLARIALDIPTELDHLWQVDVRKASVKPPTAILADLKRVARASRKRAQEVYRFRGKSVASRSSRDYVVAWISMAQRGTTTYTLNRKHPVLAVALSEGLPDKRDVERLLRFAEATIPVAQIGIAISDALDSPSAPFEDDRAELLEQLRYGISRLRVRGKTPGEALELLSTTEPFSYYPDLIESVRKGDV